MERIWGMPVGSQPPSEPPDGGAGGSRMSQTVTFKEKVLGAPAKRATVRDLIKEGAMTLEFEGGDRLLPKFSIAAPTLKQLCEPWEQCLVIKLLGRDVGFLTLRDRLPALWKVQGGLELLDVSNGYFMVKFDLEADRERVMHGGPWMLFDHYLIVRPWSPEFVASATKVDSTLVWIRFPGLGVMFYDESVLLTIASAIGKPIKVDLNTLNMTRGRFARVCVEINLNEPVVGRFFLNGVWYNVEYEGLHLLCSSCGCYGHVLRNCPHATRPEPTAHGVGEQEVTEQQSHSSVSSASAGEQSAPHVRGEIAPDPHGDWLIVKWRNRKHNLGKSFSNGRSSSHNGTTDIKELDRDIPNYPTKGVQLEAASRASFKNPREVRVPPREQGHAAGSIRGDGGHAPNRNTPIMGSNIDSKKRSRGEELRDHSRPIPASANTESELNKHKARSSHTHLSLGDPRVHEGVTGNLHRRRTNSVPQSGYTINERHDAEDSGQEIPGTEDIMQYDQPLEEEAMMA
ncbi:uncharacterized protein LOC109817506 [Cajanus cajan]|uniref:uncharacterized protein LOC109817506 n=1 Tax=Cajanus cajan TaxID=3821 RepID=UPI00098D7BA9|nr:uncharacterized protein LOC109817506 [Cajanus cajan]